MMIHESKLSADLPSSYEWCEGSRVLRTVRNEDGCDVIGETGTNCHDFYAREYF